MAKAPSKAWLERLHAQHHRLENLAPDPLLFARGFADPADGEVAGLVAAAFAYGRVGQILAALGRVFPLLGDSPRRSVVDLDCVRASHDLKGFVYRFHKTQDVVLFLHLLRRALERHGSLRALFCAGDDGGDLAGPLSRFSEAVLAGDARPALRTRAVPPGHPVRFLLASPAGGGAAKRLCLFLRWMARRDAIDPGFWLGALDPARLVVPLDTHVARVGALLGFTGRKTADWKMALEITAALRRYDPRDPVRYDFSLFRFGMAHLTP